MARVHLKKYTIGLLTAILWTAALSGCDGKGGDSSAGTTTVPTTVSTTAAITDAMIATAIPEDITSTTTQETELGGYPVPGILKTTSPLPTSPDTGLPQYVPGSIELTVAEIHWWEDYNRPYRMVYYSMPTYFSSCALSAGMVDENAYENWLYNEYYKNYPLGTADAPMIVVEFIKKFDISRDQFDALTAAYIQTAIENKVNLTNELNGAPNPDIIYTFDYDIIHEYYRYA